MQENEENQEEVHSLKTDFFEKQARETNSSVLSRGPVKVVLMLAVCLAVWGGWQVVKWFLNYDKNSAMQNVLVDVMKPRQKDGFAYVDIKIENCNPTLIKNATIAYKISGGEGRELGEGKTLVEGLIPAGDSRVFTEVKLVPLDGMPRRMQAELVDLEYGAKPDISPEISAKFVQAAAQKDKESVEAFEEITNLAPNFGAGWAGLGQAQSANGSFDKAVESFNKAIALDANDANAHYGLGLAYFYKDDKETAKKEMQKAAELAPNDLTITQANKQIGN